VQGQDRIFAVGDIAHYSNKLPLILTGFADAAQAAHAARNRLKPDEMHRFEHSTSRGIPAHTEPRSDSARITNGEKTIAEISA